MGRPREHGEETRGLLLRTAGRILAEEGAEALSIRRLADEVGTTTRAVYSLFGSKEGLLSAMYDEMSHALVQKHLQVPPSKSARAELLALALAYRAAAREHPNLYTLVFGQPVPNFTPDPRAVAHARRGLARVLETFERGLSRREFVGRDADTMAHELWALVHGLSSLELAGALAPEQRADMLWHDAVTGLVSAFTRPVIAASASSRPSTRRSTSVASKGARRRTSTGSRTARPPVGTKRA